MATLIIKKNDLQSDTTPSAVAFGKQGSNPRGAAGLQSAEGRPAGGLRRSRETYKPNVFVEFKRDHGDRMRQHSPASPA